MDDYDEFGNYIGENLDSDDDDQSEVNSQNGQQQQQQAYQEDVPLEGMDVDEDEDVVGLTSTSNAIILHDDKTYYQSSQQLYGQDVETMVQEEDAQPLSQPIIEPIKIRRFRAGNATGPERRFDDEFLLGLSALPEMVRNVVVVGHLHHGKTSLLDMLVYETHKIDVDVDKPVCSLVISPSPFQN